MALNAKRGASESSAVSASMGRRGKRSDDPNIPRGLAESGLIRGQCSTPASAYN